MPFPFHISNDQIGKADPARVRGLLGYFGIQHSLKNFRSLITQVQFVLRNRFSHDFHHVIQKHGFHAFSRFDHGGIHFGLVDYRQSIGGAAIAPLARHCLDAGLLSPFGRAQLSSRSARVMRGREGIRWTGLGDRRGHVSPLRRELSARLSRPTSMSVEAVNSRLD